MKEDILGPKVENVGMAIVQEIGENNAFIYNAYLLNFREDIIEGIIISSTGYGENVETGEKVRTSTLRHCIELMLPDEAARIEAVIEDVFGLTNEYLLSFWINDDLYDKKFIFLPEVIQEKNMKLIPKLGLKGVLIM